ncbi:TetR/AcrR family transcriptional regulator [Sporosarcina sp. 179-K 3D1 HS]|uniref:TetR/AcrR family transcriptional regulator n=1 Tax=Sporosarcina sp. 179-K 3D1 HS TaxID=3232169 RepID=UPI0039A13FE0
MREELLKQSILLFQQKGFSETSIQDIVDTINVTKGSFYYHYKSKESLLMDIQEQYIDDLLNREEAILEKNETCRERLIQIVQLIIHDIKTQGPNGRIYFREMRNLSPENAKIIRGKREKFRLNIEQLLVEGIEAGEFRKELHPKMIVFAILGVTNWSYSWFNPNGQISVEELAVMFTDFILHGVLQEI